MARTKSSFRDKVNYNSGQQRNKAANYGHLTLPKGINVFKEEPNSRVQLDILPYVVSVDNHPDRDEERGVATKGSQWYRRPYKLHRNVGAENNSYVCPTSIGKKCPICEYRAKLLAEGANWQDESVKTLRASDRDIYYVVPKNDKKLEDKPHIWDISQFLFQAKLNDELEENPDHGEFPDLENGYTLRIRFSEESIGTNKYADTSRIDFEQRDYAYDDKLIEGLGSLDDVLVIKDYKELAELFFESGDGEDAKPAAARPRETTDRSRENTSTRQRDTSAKEETAERPKDEPRETPRPKDEPKPADQPRSSFTRAKTGDAGSAKPKESDQDRPSTGGKEQCPHGHKFGVDNDKFDECENCKIWSLCCDRMDSQAAAQ
jgi:hypothetical protein